MALRRPSTNTALTLSERVASFVAELRLSDIPAEALDKAKELIAHDVGLAFGGIDTVDGGQAIELARSLSEGRGGATVIGTGLTATPLDAAFANASLIRATGMDDVLKPQGIHGGLVTLPVVFALAEQHRRSGSEALIAIVAAYETMGKLSSGLNSWSGGVFRRPTIPFGPFGGAVAAARLLGLDRAGITNAIGYAAHSAMGLSEAPWSHYYSLVARNGMMSALLAQAGGQTLPAVLEARFGFYRTFFGSVPESVGEGLDDLGVVYAILNTTTKRYHGSGLLVPPVELLREMTRTLAIPYGDVARVEVTIPSQRLDLSQQAYRGPFRTADQAAASLPFVLAVVLRDGQIDLAAYADFDDPELLALIERIELVFEAGHRNAWYVRIAITRTDGSQHVRESDEDARQHVFPPADRLASLRQSGERYVPLPMLERASEMLDQMESLRSFGDFMACLRAE